MHKIVNWQAAVWTTMSMTYYFFLNIISQPITSGPYVMVGYPFEWLLVYQGRDIPQGFSAWIVEWKNFGFNILIALIVWTVFYLLFYCILFKKRIHKLPAKYYSLTLGGLIFIIYNMLALYFNTLSPVASVDGVPINNYYYGWPFPSHIHTANGCNEGFFFLNWTIYLLLLYLPFLVYWIRNRKKTS